MRDFPAAPQPKRKNAQERSGRFAPFNHVSTCQNYVKGLFSIAAPE